MSLAVQQKTSAGLDNPSHLGLPGPDELVPSRYALKVGDTDVLVVSDGVFAMPATLMSINADPAARAAWLDEMFLAERLHALTCESIIVKGARP